MDMVHIGWVPTLHAAPGVLPKVTTATLVPLHRCVPCSTLHSGTLVHVVMFNCWVWNGNHTDLNGTLMVVAALGGNCKFQE